MTIDCKGMEQTETVTSRLDSEGEKVVNVISRKAEVPIFRGEVIDKLPKDLYVPPEALEVFLEAFEGPLDLLLYLIKRNNMDILDICVAQISEQYVAYVELIRSTRFELAADYLVMAATLTEIKSRMLLPRQVAIEEEEEDPRKNLIRRLMEYERFKQAAQELDELTRLERDNFVVRAELPLREKVITHPDINMPELLKAFASVLKRANLFNDHEIKKEALTTRERMSRVLGLIQSDRFTPFVALFSASEGRLGVVVTFLAIMELAKEFLIELVQTEPYGAIHVKILEEGADRPFASVESKRSSIQISTSDYSGQKTLTMLKNEKKARRRKS